MGLKRKIRKKFQSFSAPISFKMLDDTRLYDASNVFDNQGETDTRHGIKRYNSTSLGGRILSISFYKDTSGNRIRIAKVGSVLYKVNAAGAAVAIKSGLSENTKHRGQTINDRHIIAIEEDGIFSYNGTVFTQLGQAAGAAPTAVKAGGGTLTDATYTVGYSFYASSIGFESNISASSSQVTTETTNNTINVTDIPAAADNALIDKVRVYLKNVTVGGDFVFVEEINLGTTSSNITENPLSTIVAKTTHAALPTGGGKFLTRFGAKLVVMGNNNFKNDVFIMQANIPDAYNDTSTGVTLNIGGEGEVTGGAEGLYNNNHLEPYLVIFKKTSTTIYSEIAGVPRQVTIDPHIGCVSHDTIRVSNGIIYFMSENGWYRISNGVIEKNEIGETRSLGDGAIDDVFTREGWVNQLNSSNYQNFFSIYYPTLSHYMTFVSEGSNASFNKAYVYEKKLGGFRTFQFKTRFTSAVEGENDNGEIVVYLADEQGTIFEYSVNNARHDEDKDGNTETISAYFILPWLTERDLDSSYNFRQLFIRALSSENAITMRAFFNFNIQDLSLNSLEFANPSSGFVLDLSKLDEGVFGDERTPVTTAIDISRTAETIMIGFYQDIEDANMALLSGELYYNKNGNRNL